MYSATAQAIRDFDNQNDFERMCADILNSIDYRHVSLQAPRGGSDGGMDITYRVGKDDEEKGLACCTLRKDIDKKFSEDFSQRKKGEFQQYTLFCTAYLTRAQKLKFITYCAEKLDAELNIYDEEALRSKLDTLLKSIRRKYLHISDESYPTSETRRAIDTFLARRKEDLLVEVQGRPTVVLWSLPADFQPNREVINDLSPNSFAWKRLLALPSPSFDRLPVPVGAPSPHRIGEALRAMQKPYSPTEGWNWTFRVEIHSNGFIELSDNTHMFPLSGKPLLSKREVWHYAAFVSLIDQLYEKYGVLASALLRMVAVNTSNVGIFTGPGTGRDATGQNEMDLGEQQLSLPATDRREEIQQFANRLWRHFGFETATIYDELGKFLTR